MVHSLTVHESAELLMHTKRSAELGLPKCLPSRKGSHTQSCCTWSWSARLLYSGLLV